MTSRIRQLAEEFHTAQSAWKSDPHDAAYATALREARERLDAEADRLRERLPFRTRKLPGAGHLVAQRDVDLHAGHRARGQTLCGAPPGRPRRGSPPPCTRCLLAAERYLVEGPPPLELEL